MRKFIPLSLALFLNFIPLCACLAASGGSYQGLEFYGSSQMSRPELEKLLGLRNGASYRSMTAAAERLKRELKARRLEGNIQIVTGDGTDLYLSVDVLGGYDDMASRILKDPHRVAFRSEEPVQILAKLHQRLELIEAQGRAATEEWRDGIKYFSDEPCNQMVTDLIRHCGPMREELIFLIDHDPNAVRRATAVELLSWSGGVQDTAARLLAAVDDVDVNVRTLVTRYLFNNLALLPDDFPFEDMVDVYSRDLNRPSHDDRSKALYVLMALVKRRPDLIKQVQEQAGKRIKFLKERSLVPSIKLAGAQFDRMFTRSNVGLTDVKPNYDFLPP